MHDTDREPERLLEILEYIRTWRFRLVGYW